MTSRWRHAIRLFVYDRLSKIIFLPTDAILVSPRARHARVREHCTWGYCSMASLSAASNTRPCFQVIIHASHRRQHPGSFASVRHSCGQLVDTPTTPAGINKPWISKTISNNGYLLTVASGFVLNHPQSRQIPRKGILIHCCAMKNALFA